jgi:hypothetical protein
MNMLNKSYILVWCVITKKNLMIPCTLNETERKAIAPIISNLQFSKPTLWKKRKKEKEHRVLATTNLINLGEKIDPFKV